MYLLPSTSTSVAPDARAMKSGEPPTDLNARTGLSTPPGSSCCAREKSFCDRVVFMETTFYLYGSLGSRPGSARSSDESALPDASPPISTRVDALDPRRPAINPSRLVPDPRRLLSDPCSTVSTLDKNTLLGCRTKETRTSERRCSRVV